MIKAVIFDFNGTMIFDSSIHRAVWRTFMPEHTGRELTDDEIEKNILGRDNAHILRHYLGNISDAEADRLTYEKEAAYRRLCLTDREHFRLVDGLEQFLDCLKTSGIPRTIATGSEILNVKFFFEQFELSKWFDFENVIYDDGSFPGKPAPDIYLRAAARLSVAPSVCLVFEDSLSGVLAAHNAGIWNVVAINETENASFYERSGGVNFATDNFSKFSRFLNL